MKSNNFLTVLKAVLSIVGGMILGHNLFGIPIDGVWWENATGVLLGVSAVWISAAQKALTEEALQGALRQALTFVGAFFVAKGWLKGDVLQAVLASLPVFGPMIYAWITRKKNQSLQNGTINVNELNT